MSRTKITAAIMEGQLLRVQTTRKCVLLRPYQCGKVGGRWCFDAVVLYKRRQAIERFREEELVAVHLHGNVMADVARTLETSAMEYDSGTLVRWKTP